MREATKNIRFAGSACEANVPLPGGILRGCVLGLGLRLRRFVQRLGGDGVGLAGDIHRRVAAPAGLEAQVVGLVDREALGAGEREFALVLVVALGAVGGVDVVHVVGHLVHDDGAGVLPGIALHDQRGQRGAVDLDLRLVGHHLYAGGVPVRRGGGDDEYRQEHRRHRRGDADLHAPGPGARPAPHLAQPHRKAPQPQRGLDVFRVHGPAGLLRRALSGRLDGGAAAGPGPAALCRGLAAGLVFRAAQRGHAGGLRFGVASDFVFAHIAHIVTS